MLNDMNFPFFFFHLGVFYGLNFKYLWFTQHFKTSFQINTCTRNNNKTTTECPTNSTIPQEKGPYESAYINDSDQLAHQ